MDIRGLILVDASDATSEPLLNGSPLAMMDVTGASPLVRMVERLRHFGVSPITIIAEGAACADYGPLPHEATCLPAVSGRFWRVAEGTFNELAQKADLVLLIRLGAYAEIDFGELVQSHLQGHHRVSQGTWGAEHLEIFCLSAARRNDAASLFRSRLRRCRSERDFFAHQGYVNPLASLDDLRQFCIDVLTMRTETPPAGLEIRPGIWAASTASIEKGSRILAPAFIGSSARIRGGAVITRCTSIEHHAQVDCGTIVENSTVLPYVYLGAGLDLAHSVASAGHIANLRRHVTVDVADATLLGQVSFTTGRKLFSFAAYLPARISSLFGKAAAQPASVNGHQPRPALVPRVPVRGSKSADDLVSNLAVARRYGNQ
jgi:hypothetical protein